MSLRLNIFYLHFQHAACLQKDFKEQITRKGYNCTLPWIQSMSGEISNENSSKSTCNNAKDFDNLFLEGILFSKQIARYKNSKCSGN